MTTDKGSTGFGVSLDDLKADKLRDVAYSAGVEVEGNRKEDVVSALEEADVRLGAEGWERDGDPFELESRPKGSGPSDSVMLYGFKRSATTDEFVAELTDWSEERGLEVRESDTDSGKETLKIVRPAEVHEPEEKSPEYTCAGTKADGSPCTREVDEEGAYCHQHGTDNK